MLAARAVAVAAKLVTKLTAPLIIETPLTVSVSIDPAAPVAKVMVPVADTSPPPAVKESSLPKLTATQPVDVDLYIDVNRHA